MIKRINILILLTTILSMSIWSQSAESDIYEDAFSNIIAEEAQESATIKWSINCNLVNSLQNESRDLIVRYTTKAEYTRWKGGFSDGNWQYSSLADISASEIEIKDLVGDESYYFQVGISRTGNINEAKDSSDKMVWSDKVSAKIKSGWNMYKLLILIGALGFFIFGMKTMSEGIQKLAGDKLQKILGAATSNRFAGVLTGFTTTSIIQSSSATTVMVVSFVNAGLLNLRQAIGVIMGANIGTTVTSFLLLVFAFGKFSISDYSLPIIAFGMPM